MKCPKCNSEQTTCYDSRSTRQDARRLRRYKCLDCGHRFKTLELYDEDVACLEDIPKKMEAALNALRAATMALEA